MLLTLCQHVSMPVLHCLLKHKRLIHCPLFYHVIIALTDNVKEGPHYSVNMWCLAYVFHNELWWRQFITNLTLSSYSIRCTFDLLDSTRGRNAPHHQLKRLKATVPVFLFSYNNGAVSAFSECAACNVQFTHSMRLKWPAAKYWTLI